MLDLIFAEHKISPSAWNIPSCFYKRRLDLEEVFSVPYTESRTGSIIGRVLEKDLGTETMAKPHS